MRRYWCTIILIIIATLSLNAEEFEKYDFTFYKTVDDSVAIMNEERFGIDYTGYGFLGSNMTTGLYIRFGIQTPYSTLISIFDRQKENSSDKETNPILPDEPEPTMPDPNPDIDTNSKENAILVSPREISPRNNDSSDIDGDKPSIDDGQKIEKEKEFIFSFTIGPAFRHFISESVIWYMGMGITSIIKDTTSSSIADSGMLTSLEIKLGTDFDMGFRLDLKEDTSLRIGVHITTDLLTYSSQSISGGTPPSHSTTNKLSADIFTSVGEKSSTKANGYIGLAHVFKPKDVSHYRYSNKTAKLGGGELSKI